MLTEHYGEIVFRLSIFCLLSYKLYSLSKSYLYPFLLNQISNERNQQTELVEKEKLLISTRHRIENQIYNQKKMLMLLERNVQVWHKAKQEELMAQEKECRNIGATIYARRVLQGKNIMVQEQIKQGTLQAIAQAECQLASMYALAPGEILLKNVVVQLNGLSDKPLKSV